jgi:hypothetical protein
MKHTEILEAASSTLKQREGLYGPAAGVFENIAKISSIICVKEISPYDVAMIIHVMKLVRMRESRTEADHYIDGVNYLAFAGEFADLQVSKDIAFGDDIKNLITNKEPAPAPIVETPLEKTIEEMAAQLVSDRAPVKEPETPVTRTADYMSSATISEFGLDKKPKK